MSPLVGGRVRDQRGIVLALFATATLGLLGILLQPATSTWVWALLLGAGIGAGQGLSGLLYARRGHDHAHAAALSAFAQTLGYLLGAAGPVLATLLAAVAGWPATLGILVALLAGATILSKPAASSRHDAR